MCLEFLSQVFNVIDNVMFFHQSLAQSFELTNMTKNMFVSPPSHLEIKVMRYHVCDRRVSRYVKSVHKSLQENRVSRYVKSAHKSLQENRVLICKTRSHEYDSHNQVVHNHLVETNQSQNKNSNSSSKSPNC